MVDIKKGDIVVYDVNNSNASNTFIVNDLINDYCLLEHPLFKEVLIKCERSKLNKTNARIKNSSERGLDFAKSNITVLDHSTIGDLEALCVYFVVRRNLTPRQKKSLSKICGEIATIKLDNDVKNAMDLVTMNVGILDDFNLMWYNNFKGLFNGTQLITSKKQKEAIFNIAGFVMAELATPVAYK